MRPTTLFVIAVVVAVFLAFLNIQQAWKLDAACRHDDRSISANNVVAEQDNPVSRALAQPKLIVPQQQQQDPCQAEFERVHKDQVRGLTNESLERGSRTWIGNQQRLAKFAAKLDSSQQVNVVVSGGSITMGHGIHDKPRNRYSGQLESWLNKYFPSGKQHKVYNIGAHGADMCNLAKRMNILYQDLPSPDLFVLEFAVNDYQGQDHIETVEHRFDVFFDGFQDIAVCAEVVINKLLRQYPEAAVMFLEFRTAIPSRRTASLLHMGVAQHYQVPVISYAEAMYPEYLHLLSLLNKTESMSAPKPAKDDSPSLYASTVLPYPYGCVSCRPNDMDVSFRKGYCKSICKILSVNNFMDCNDEAPLPSNRQKCFPAIFAHDCVHPSKVGHSIAKDLLVHAIASIKRDECRRRNQDKQQQQQLVPPLFEHALPSTGWLVDSLSSLKARASFELVQDTMQMYSHWDELTPTNYTSGWSYKNDAPWGEKFGWISTNVKGGEVIQFDIDLPQHGCYAVYLAVLRSYTGMGKFTIQVEDLQTHKITTVEADGLWKAHISVWSDIQVTQDDESGCTGRCRVYIHTHPQVEGRDGNKVKVLTLSARKCHS